MATDVMSAEHSTQNRVAPDHKIVIIGAGLSGIGMGISLLEAKLDDFVILERGDGVGGTWRINTYPGIGVDVPSTAYQFSYELNPKWSRAFAKGNEIREYVEHCSQKYGVDQHIRFGVDVVSRKWDETNKFWRLQIRTESGVSEVTSRFVISAIGPFVEPKAVDIDGVESFNGKLITSQEWDHDYDLTGKRVAIIGTGASAVQIIPEIAAKVKHLDVFQRTPIWVAPKVDPLRAEAVKKLYSLMPALQKPSYKISSTAIEFILVFMVVDPKVAPRLAKIAEFAQKQFWYRSQVKDREVRAKLTPQYGLGCKRPAVSNRYLKTFNREDVSLVTESITRITPDGVETVDGQIRKADVLIMATGFATSNDPDSYRKRPVIGRSGFDLGEYYDKERLASYESVSIPGLPNHFMIFGPYGWTGGTWHHLVETASIHIVRLLKEADKRGAVDVEVKVEPTEEWTHFVRERLSDGLWLKSGSTCPSARSYYFDKHGDVPFLRPTSLKQARKSQSTFPFDHYSFK